MDTGISNMRRDISARAEIEGEVDRLVDFATDIMDQTKSLHLRQDDYLAEIIYTYWRLMDGVNSDEFKIVLGSVRGSSSREDGMPDYQHRYLRHTMSKVDPNKLFTGGQKRDFQKLENNLLVAWRYVEVMWDSTNTRPECPSRNQCTTAIQSLGGHDGIYGLVSAYNKMRRNEHAAELERSRENAKREEAERIRDDMKLAGFDDEDAYRRHVEDEKRRMVEERNRERIRDCLRNWQPPARLPVAKDAEEGIYVNFEGAFVKVPLVSGNEKFSFAVASLKPYASR